jgi:hypothetical protein
MKRLFVVVSIKKIVIVLCAKKQLRYSVRILITKGVFVVNFRKNSSAKGVCGTSLLGRRGVEKVKRDRWRSKIPNFYLSAHILQTLEPRIIKCSAFVLLMNAHQLICNFCHLNKIYFKISRLLFHWLASNHEGLKQICNLFIFNFGLLILSYRTLSRSDFRYGHQAAILENQQ